LKAIAQTFAQKVRLEVPIEFTIAWMMLIQNGIWEIFFKKIVNVIHVLLLSNSHFQLTVEEILDQLLTVWVI
jgi:hypothetical protein